MTSETRKTAAENKETRTPALRCWGVCLWLVVFLYGSACTAVTSKVVRHNSSADLLKGQTKDVVIGSKGTLQLGWAWQTPVEKFQDVWSINSIVVAGETIFAGTSPNGGVYKYSLGQLTKIYPPEPEKEQATNSDNYNDADINEPAAPKTVKKDRHLANEHIFAMATDVAGRLLVAVSGEKCRLLRFERDKAETIFEPNDAKYIFAIAADKKGNIYLGTGPEGKVYKYDPFAYPAAELIYDSLDKNILSLAAGQDGFLYAGSDSRGLIYKINPNTKTATVLYDSEQPEITALMFGPEGELYAAATSAEITQTEAKFAAQMPLAGRPEAPPETGEDISESEGGRKLQIPSTKKGPDDKAAERRMPLPKPPRPGKASYIYKVTKEGYVTDIFTESVILFSLASKEGTLLVGTGNSAQLFTVEPAMEEQALIYEDEQASQITAITVRGDDVYLGTANPAKLVKLGKAFASEGTYTSDLVDAGQPANWGKLQIDADVPPGCEVLVACRSGNVKDINDPSFSDWTEPQEITGPVQLGCPLGRFCQYKLILRIADGSKSPLVREVAVASTVPNLAPKVDATTVNRIETPGKTGIYKIGYKAEDENGDKLIYKIDFRKLGRTSWIELEDEHEAENFEWDGKTLEDGRYEVRVTASDERGNTPATRLTGSRISDPVIIDNTAPVVKEHSIGKKGKAVTVKLRVVDELTAIGKTDYTIDSNSQWKGAIPDDLVFDTMDEHFTIVIEDLKPGEHVLTVRVSDDVGNTTYRTFEIDMAGG